MSRGNGSVSTPQDESIATAIRMIPSVSLIRDFINLALSLFERQLLDRFARRYPGQQ
jgi:hypothetical protein